MKLFYIFVSTMAFGGLVLTSCGEKETANEGDGGEETTVEAFGKELEDRGIVQAFGEMKELAANAREEPIAMFKAMDDLDERLEPLVTDGLPADLKQAFDRFKSQVKEIAVNWKEMPIPLDVFEDGEAALTAWVTEKVADDPEFLAKFQKEMGAWETKMTELGSKMEESGDEIREVFEKYGIEGLNQSLKED